MAWKPLPNEPLKYFSEFPLGDLVQVMIWVKNSLELPGKYSGFVHTLVRRMNEPKKILLQNQLKQTQLSHPIVIDKILVELFSTHSVKISTRAVEEIGFEDQLFDLLLYFNDLQYEKHHVPLEATTNEAMWTLSLAQAYTGLSNVEYAKTATIKHLIFLNFLQKHFG